VVVLADGDEEVGAVPRRLLLRGAATAAGRRLRVGQPRASEVLTITIDEVLKEEDVDRDVVPTERRTSSGATSKPPWPLTIAPSSSLSGPIAPATCPEGWPPPSSRSIAGASTFTPASSPAANASSFGV